MSLRPIPDQPVDVFGDCIDVMCILLGRIGIVEAQVTTALIFHRDAEV